MLRARRRCAAAQTRLLRVGTRRGRDGLERRMSGHDGGRGTRGGIGRAYSPPTERDQCAPCSKQDPPHAIAHQSELFPASQSLMNCLRSVPVSDLVLASLEQCLYDMCFPEVACSACDSPV